MAVTESQSVQPASITNFAAGSYVDTGTAAAISITCGFKPRYVKVFNVTAASTGLVSMEWVEGMTAAHGIKTYDEGTSETGITKLTSLGITVSDRGFTIGLDTDLNVTSEQLHWIALG